MRLERACTTTSHAKVKTTKVKVGTPATTTGTTTGNQKERPWRQRRIQVLLCNYNPNGKGEYQITVPT
eukprot:6113418-Amphidinium_carterae.1